MTQTLTLADGRAVFDRMTLAAYLERDLRLSALRARLPVQRSMLPAPLPQPLRHCCRNCRARAYEHAAPRRTVCVAYAQVRAEFH